MYGLKPVPFKLTHYPLLPSLPQSGVFRIVLCAARKPEFPDKVKPPAKNQPDAVPRMSWARDARKNPNRANLLRKRGTIFYGSTIQTIDGSDVARVPCPVYHGHRAVLHLRVHHQPEHGAGASPAVDLRPSLRVGHAGRVGVLPGLLCLCRAHLQAD